MLHSRDEPDSRLILHALIHVLERLHDMPTQADFDAAVAAISTAIDAEFTDLGQTITDETAKVLAALTAAGGIPQSAIDSVNALGARIATAVAASKTAVQAELPAPSA